MLYIPFSHRHYYKFTHFNPFDPAYETVLAGYTIKHDLPHEFIEYDTVYWEGERGIWRDRKYFSLGRPPYLVLILRTKVEPPINYEFWTTVRCPWRMAPKPNDGKWRIPKKYREARGQQVRVVLMEGK